MHEGIKLKSLPSGSNNTLYRGSFLSKSFINIIENSIKKKQNGELFAVILFTKIFLTFTKDEIIENNFLNSYNNNNQLFKVLFVLEKDNRIDYSLFTHTDFENSILFFPFSSFDITNITHNNGKYEIKFSYVGKYLESIKNDETIWENKIPDSDFQKEIINFGLIDEEYKNFNIKTILEKYEKYKEEYKKDYIAITNERNKIIKNYNFNEKKKFYYWRNKCQ